MSKVAVVGVGQTAFTRACGVSIKELCFEAFKEALEDSGLQPQGIDETIICSAPEYDKQRSPAGAINEYLGLNPKPTFYAESICSSSTTGIRIAYGLITSGLSNVVAVLGFQKMSELSQEKFRKEWGEGQTSCGSHPSGFSCQLAMPSSPETT
jgi:acetyl-CoA C-acetyltransferase